MTEDTDTEIGQHVSLSSVIIRVDVMTPVRIMGDNVDSTFVLKLLCVHC